LAAAFLAGWLVSLGFVHLRPQGQRPTAAAAVAGLPAEAADRSANPAAATATNRHAAPQNEAAPQLDEAAKTETPAKDATPPPAAPVAPAAAAPTPLNASVGSTTNTGTAASSDAEAERLREREVTKALFGKNRENLRVLNSR
jgi:hypothetical protein